MKKITSRPFWDYLLFLSFSVSIILFAVSFFVPKINTSSLLSYIILFIAYLLSEKFSKRYIGYSEKAFSYSIIYWLFICLIIYKGKNTRILGNSTLFYVLSICTLIIIFAIILQAIYFSRKIKGTNKQVSLMFIISIVVIIFTVVPFLFKIFPK